MTCTYCGTENPPESKVCQSCDLPFEDFPALSLVTPVDAPAGKKEPHPFANPQRTKLVQGFQSFAASLAIVPFMAVAGGIVGILLFGALIGGLDYYFVRPELTAYYLGTLTRRALIAGLLGGLPIGAYFGATPTTPFFRKWRADFTALRMILALPFFILPPIRLLSAFMRLSSAYPLPSSKILAGLILALPFFALARVCQTLFKSPRSR